jgi:single-stranded DNA-specific DHH superfamily exonuclease
MLNQKQINEIRDYLNKAQNPLFFFDNDVDGLCSFLLLQRFIGRGKGVAIKTFPDLSVDYFRKVNELNADYIFILDKPVVSKEFFAEAEKFNVPVVWIDHHQTDIKEIPNFVNYYNPLLNKEKSNEPTTYLCYKIANKKDDLWIAVTGCISDRFIPEFYTKFVKEYPDLSINFESGLKKDASDIYYNSPIGKLIQLFSFALKDKTTNVVTMIKFLMNSRSPYEVLEETSKNHLMHKRFREIDKKYKKLLERAKSITNDRKLFFFKYGGDLSISSDLSNELIYRFPDKIIAVAYVLGDKANISLRGKKIRKIVLEVIKDFEDATGGGHEQAVGVKVRLEDLEKFRKRLGEIIEK